jgi:hypothetical protein
MSAMTSGPIPINWTTPDHGQALREHPCRQYPERSARLEDYGDAAVRQRESWRRA